MEQDIETEGDGHNPELDEALAEEGGQGFAGGHMTLDRNRKIIRMDNRQYASVLQQMLHSIESDLEFRQQLARAVWQSNEEADEWCNAYDECKRHGADTEWLVNRLIARGAGTNGWLLKSIMDTISHTTYTVNSPNKKAPWGFLRGREQNDNKRSPLF